MLEVKKAHKKAAVVVVNPKTGKRESIAFTARNMTQLLIQIGRFTESLTYNDEVEKVIFVRQ